MLEEIEFDRFVGVYVSRNREAGAVGDVDIDAVDYLIFLLPTIHFSIPQPIIDSSAMGNLAATVRSLPYHQQSV